MKVLKSEYKLYKVILRAYRKCILSNEGVQIEWRGIQIVQSYTEGVQSYTESVQKVYTF
jgi:hypothetical protein